MDLPSQLTNPWIAGGIASLLVVVALWVWLRRRRSKRPAARLKAAASDCLDHFLIPDGDGGEIHIDYALLSRKGILIIDLRDVAGHVFGSNAMQDWTVIGEGRRYTFSNPQPALYDRVAAVKRLLPNIPVRGLVTFGPQADFNKGLPDNVIMLDELVSGLAAEKRESGSGDWPEDLSDAWASLRRAAVETQVGHLIRS